MRRQVVQWRETKSARRASELGAPLLGHVSSAAGAGLSRAVVCRRVRDQGSRDTAALGLFLCLRWHKPRDACSSDFPTRQTLPAAIGSTWL